MTGRRIGLKTWACALALGLGLASFSLHIQSCSGNTTGVDNPGVSELPIRFFSEAGEPTSVTGELEIYAKDQNPIVKPLPLLRRAISQNHQTLLLAEDFDTLTDSLGLLGDSALQFNVLFRSTEQTGAFVSGFTYLPAQNAFVHEKASNPRLVMQPRPLITYTARVQRETIHGDLGRIYLAGTPFWSTVIDSQCNFSNITQGQYVMRYLHAEGQVFAVKESLDTRVNTTATITNSIIDSLIPGDTLPRFSIDAGPDQTHSFGDFIKLNGQIIGIDTNDTSLSIVWSPLWSIGTNSDWIENREKLNSRVFFYNRGQYELELAATLGTQILRDTVRINIAPGTDTLRTRFVYPKTVQSIPSDTLFQVEWWPAWKGQVRLEYALVNDSPENWLAVLGQQTSKDSAFAFTWTSPPVFNQATPCLLRLRDLLSDSLLAQTLVPFYLLP